MNMQVTEWKREVVKMKRETKHEYKREAELEQPMDFFIIEDLEVGDWSLNVYIGLQHIQGREERPELHI